MLINSFEDHTTRYSMQAISLVLALVLSTGCSTRQQSSSTDLLPEDNLDLLLEGLERGQANKKQADWVREMVDNSYPRFTDRCEVFFKQLQTVYWGYTETGEVDDFEDLERRWADVYDLKYVEFGHAFESGNCGWEVKAAESIRYLGLGNDGDWYEVVVKGGCHKGDRDNRVIRVLKLVESGSNWLIDAIFAPVPD